MSKYKVVLSKSVTTKIKKLNKRDAKIIKDAIRRIAEDPTLGKPVKFVEIESWRNETCDVCDGGCFEAPVNMFWDKKSNEIFCSCPICDDRFWMKKSELVNGRKKLLTFMRKEIFKTKKS